MHRLFDVLCDPYHAYEVIDTALEPNEIKSVRSYEWGEYTKIKKENPPSAHRHDAGSPKR